MIRTLVSSSSSTSSTTTTSLLLASAFTKPSFSRFALSKKPFLPLPRKLSFHYKPPMNILNKLGFGPKTPSTMDPTIPQGPDDDVPAPGQEFAQFGAGCFWGVELAYQRVPGVTKTEVGYSQGLLHDPSYEDVCSGSTNHNEVVRVQYDPKEGSFESLLDVFWARHDPTTLS